MSIAAKNKPKSLEARKNMSLAKIGKPPSKQCILASIKYHIGRKASKEWKKHISEGVTNSYVNNPKLRQLRGKTFLKYRTPELYAKMVATRRKNGSYIVSEEQKEKERIAMKKLFDEHPEKHPNARMANRKTLHSQTKLYKHVLTLYPDAMMEYRIPGTRRFADIAIPSLKLDIEYDCEYWHNKENDIKRDKEIRTAGWEVIRFDKSIFKKLEKSLNNKEYINCY